MDIEGAERNAEAQSQIGWRNWPMRNQEEHVDEAANGPKGDKS